MIVLFTLNFELSRYGTSYQTFCRQKLSRGDCFTTSKDSETMQKY